MDSPVDHATRLDALERQVALLTADVAVLRAAAGPATPRATAPPPVAPELERIQSAGERLYRRASRSAGLGMTGDEIESFIGRYGTLLLAALVILMAVGVLVEVAVARGMLTAAVRVALGAGAAIVLGGAGLHFRRRGELRYGDVLLAIALAVVDLVAWGAGPRLHLVPPLVALVIVDVVAGALAMLALHDDNEFLFVVAVGGALSAPFVTSSGGGTALMLLSYGTAVLVSALRVVRDPGWQRAFLLLVSGVVVYSLAAAALPTGTRWYDPYLVVTAGGACALAALVTAQQEWRGMLARAFLAATLVGVPVAWDRGGTGPIAGPMILAGVLALLTYVALAIREPGQPHWTASALTLPLLSLGIAYPVADSRTGAAPVLGVWALFALGAWQYEGRRAERDRGATHLLAGGILGALALVAQFWQHPLQLVAALGTWSIMLAAAAAREANPLPLIALAATLGGAALSAVDQLASRLPYGYTPFLTRSSASALCATVALGLCSALIGRADEADASAGVQRWAERPLRLGLTIGFAIVWGRMELAHAFSRDLATFLLILYYAACGLATIVAGRALAVQRLRLAGLGMAIYAAVKAMMEAAAIEGVALRVGSYGAVGAFLLGAGYLYRARGKASGAAEPDGVAADA